MRFLLVPVLALLAAAVPGPASRPLLKPTAMDRAVDRAIEFLASTQNKTDGSWTAGRSGKNVAITSLSVMAFLSAGHVPGEGKYAKAIENGVRWVLSMQQPNGLLATEGGHEMYHHGIATLMLAEVSGMLDKELGKEVERVVREKDMYLEAQEFEKAASLREKEKLLRGRDEDMKREWDKRKGRGPQTVGEEDIEYIVSRWTGIPLSKLEEKESAKLARMEEALHGRIVGQGDAVAARV